MRRSLNYAETGRLHPSARSPLLRSTVAPPPQIGYPTLTAGVSIVRAIDITELRNAVVAIE